MLRNLQKKQTAVMRHWGQRGASDRRGIHWSPESFKMCKIRLREGKENTRSIGTQRTGTEKKVGKRQEVRINAGRKVPCGGGI